MLLGVKLVVITDKSLYNVTLHDDSASGGGSYKQIRKDCIKVWSSISKDAEALGDDYGLLAKAQLGNMAFFSLYEMAYYDYKNANDELLFRETLKDNIIEINSCSFISRKEKIPVRAVLWCGCIVKYIIRIRAKRKRR